MTYTKLHDTIPHVPLGQNFPQVALQIITDDRGPGRHTDVPAVREAIALLQQTGRGDLPQGWLTLRARTRRGASSFDPPEIEASRITEAVQLLCGAVTQWATSMPDTASARMAGVLEVLGEIALNDHLTQLGYGPTVELPDLPEDEAARFIALTEGPDSPAAQGVR